MKDTNSPAKKRMATTRNAQPADEDTTIVLVPSSLATTSTNNAHYHFKSDDSPTEPACDNIRDDAEFSPIRLEDVPEHATLCKYCDPDYKIPQHRDGDTIAAKLEEADPDEVSADKTIVTDGGIDREVVDAIIRVLREDLDPGQSRIYYARRIADKTEHSPSRVGYYLSRIIGEGPHEQIDVDAPDLSIEKWRPASSVCRWEIERLETAAEAEGLAGKQLVTDGGDA